MAHLVGLLGRGGLAGANGPHGLVGDDDALQLLLGDAAQGNLGLHGNQLAGDALLPLLQGLTHAEDDGQAGIQSGAHTLLHGDVGLSEVLAALAVADDDDVHAHGAEHLSADFAGVGAALFPVAVLRADLDVGAGGGLLGGSQVHKGGAGHNVAGRVLHQGGDGGNQLFGLGGGLVHFPVAGDDNLAQCFIHENSLLW